MPGGKACGVGLDLWIATPVKPPAPGTCCCSWLFQLATIVHELLLTTVASQCTVPSELHEMATFVSDRHVSHLAGVDVLVEVEVGVLVPVLVLVALLDGTLVGVLVTVPVAVLTVVLVEVAVSTGVPVAVFVSLGTPVSVLAGVYVLVAVKV